MGDRKFNKTCCFVVSQINTCRFYGEHLSLVRYKDKARGRVSIESLIMKPVKPLKQELLTEGGLPACSYKLVNIPGKIYAIPDDKHNLH